MNPFPVTFFITQMGFVELRQEKEGGSFRESNSEKGLLLVP